MGMNIKPERLAWTVLIVAFVIFALFACFVPAAATEAVQNYTTARPAHLDIVYGTVLVRQAGSDAEQSAKDGLAINPGDQVRTAGSSRAILWLHDQSNVELGPDTAVVVAQSQATTFSRRHSAVRLELLSGRPSVNIALPSTENSTFIASTRFGDLLLSEGSFEVDLTRPSLGEVIVRVGEAAIEGKTGKVTATTWQRISLSIEEGPSGPLSLERNLLTDSHFDLARSQDLPLGAAWKGDERNSEGNVGSVTVATDPAGNYLRFLRSGMGHGENYAVQNLGIEVGQYRSLKLRAEVRVDHQSLSGGGVAGTEYPIHIRVRYINSLGREATFETGYYIQNTDNYPTTFGRSIPQGSWQQVEIDLAALDARPVYLYYLEFAASGWDYDSGIRHPAILAE